ncbi:MAG: hypothetical protein IJ079_06410 [Lachnospiraceae bacterium]|nr:hypothetical protein [Lachnospiraceae bacterium]MBR1568437.1 hypothetical protein [Lachnospiraceae bacterium]
MKYQYLFIFGIAVTMGLAGCGNSANTNQAETDTSEDVSVTDLSQNSSSNTDADTNVLLPSDLSGYRKISDDMPEKGPSVSNPGTREHFSFTDEDRTYVFTETETLWLYNQSLINDLHTEFMLNIKGNKVTLVPLSAEDKSKVPLSLYQDVYEDENVKIYRGRIMDVNDDGEDAADDSSDNSANDANTSVDSSSGETADSGSMDEGEPMYLTLYDLVFQVDGWQTVIEQGTISSDSLYQELAQMGTAVQEAGNKETLSNVIDGYRSSPVFEDYCFAYREGMTHTGFFYCSPNSKQAVHDSVTVYMSIYLPDWDSYAVLHAEAVPSDVNSLEDTGEEYDGLPILADYAGELKYYLIGEDGMCVYLEGAPGEAGSSDKVYTVKEAAYIFRLVFSK